jgi:glutathione S-transferase
MIELWHCPDTRSFRVLWVLEELGLPYDLHLLPFPPRLRAPEYLQVNPLGTIPTMRIGETFMTESAAIVQYLATRHAPNDLIVAVDDAAYGDWLNWQYLARGGRLCPLVHEPASICRSRTAIERVAVRRTIHHRRHFCWVRAAPRGFPGALGALQPSRSALLVASSIS